MRAAGRRGPRTRRPAAALGIMAASLLFWTAVLWGDFSTRAFDASDPSEQMDYARASAESFRGQGPIAWLSAVASEPLAKPVQNGLLSAAILLGAPPDAAGYLFVNGLVILALLCLAQWQVWRRLGATALALFCSLCAASNVFLGQAFYGGHSWLGQLFLWGAVSVVLRPGRAGPAAETGASYLLGLLLGLSFLSSYHMLPFVIFVGLLWAWLAGRRLAARRWRGWWQPLAALLGGGLTPLILLEGSTFAVPKSHYWQVLHGIVGRATDIGLEVKSVHGYSLDLLLRSESAPFSAALLLMAARGWWVLWWRLRRGEAELAAWVLVPPAAYAFLELPGVLRLGRVYLPVLLFVFVLAAAGGAELLQRLRQSRRRLAATAAAAALILLSTSARRYDTWRAFHAGAELRRTMREAGAPSGRLVTVGISVPYIYLRDQPWRVGLMRDLRAALDQGAEWVLVSRLSSWFWHDFLGPARFDIPLADVYASPAPYTAVPGVESLPFQLFTNDAMYFRIRTGEIPFPVENRLYRARDFLAACGAGP